MTKFPAYRQAGNNQIITNHQTILTEKLGIGVYLIIDAWNLVIRIFISTPSHPTP